ncbi:MAG: cytochrome ubiquinol oxidase subunit I [Deltaproteobacteria bacterium]|nr:cytochrome ubiquinol oxidase subunit I [Deltaproteobacteria bacterium]
MTHIEFPILGAKWAIGSIALFHTAVASLAIGFAFFVTLAQILAYIHKDRRYDYLAKRVQLVHVCIYNIGTINAIGLVFALSGLYPQFWSQIFVQFYWPLIIEEFLFFLLATTLTFHYFFWEHLWGHKKLHIFLGALLTPFFFLQFYIINGLGGFMLTPGAGEAELSLSTGVLGWDRLGFYNPSFLMLTLHRTLANFAYGGFAVAGICGTFLYFVARPKLKDYYEEGGRLAFYVGFAAFLSLPIIGYFYAHVLKSEAPDAYVSLMWGRGDIVSGGVDWWWLKHICVAGMLGMSLIYFRKTSDDKRPFSIPTVMVYSVGLFYLMFYVAMGMVMTWAFFWYMLASCVVGGALGWHLLNYHKGSARAVFLLIGILSFTTVMLGGYSREAARPRFVDRISHYDNVFVPEERQPYLMVDVDVAGIPKAPAPHQPTGPIALIRLHCIKCHTLDRVKSYRLDNWDLIVRQMIAYGLELTHDDREQITAYLKAGEPY